MPDSIIFWVALALLFVDAIAFLWNVVQGRGVTKDQEILMTASVILIEAFEILDAEMREQVSEQAINLINEAQQHLADVYY